MDMKALAVSEAVNLIKRSLESEFFDLTIVGEVSNFTSSAAGHFYFTLSDKDASLSCAMFKMDAMRNPIIRKIRNGEKVYLRGPISVYAKRGTFQLLGKKILKYGQGDLKAQFEFLKEKLRSQGFFDLENKKEIPRFPKKIAVVTAKQGAALQDFLNVMKRRSLSYDILICPALVQGDAAPASIIKALNVISSRSDIDLIVITRGGGSMEDLWAFNNEELVKCIYNLKAPVISAIGHQVDFTLSDFVADMRCETPTAAAEVISQPQTSLMQSLNHNMTRLKGSFRHFKSDMSERLTRINPLRVRYLLERKIFEKQKNLDQLAFFKQADLIGIYDKQLYLDELLNRYQNTVSDQTKNYNSQLEKFDALLGSLNPYQVLERGYSYVSVKDKVISKVEEFKLLEGGEQLTIRFADGQGKVQKV